MVQPAGRVTIAGSDLLVADPEGRWTRSLWRPTAVLERLLLDEIDRWVLWTPVAVGIGIAGYFALSGPPSLAIVLAVLAAAIVAGLHAARSRERPLPLLLGAALALAGLGFGLAHWRIVTVEGQPLQRAASYRLEGRVLELSPTAKGARLLLDRLAIERLPPEATPHAVRVSVRASDGIAVGDRVRMLARLQPPSPPLLPGGFDFARAAWFEGIGAVGFAMGAVERVGGDSARGIAERTGALREAIAERILERAPGDAGRMSAALLTGLQAGISDEVWADMQRSGLAHLISISGLHMSMVAGTLFLALRYGLALVPALALRWPVKKLAALGGILGVTGYLLISGMSVPAERSWLMVVVSFSAILLDRNPLSPRILALAALWVLWFRPESLLGVSFQLSFAAVLGLISAYEAGARLLMRRAEAIGTTPFSGPLLYLAGIMLTTMIATVATGPLTAWHFHSIASYSVLANLIAVPVSSFVTMPAGLIAIGLMPFGLEGAAVAVMALSVELILVTAHWVATLPGAAILLAPQPVAALLLFFAGGLWLALWTRSWRLLGLLPLLVALVLAVFARAPDLVVRPGLAQIAVSTPAGTRLLERERDGFVREVWSRGLGVDAFEAFPRTMTGAVDGIACDPDGCIVTREGRRVSLAFTAGAVLEDCGTADLVIAATGAETCRGGAVLVGPRALHYSLGLQVEMNAGGVLIESVAERRGAWPWVPARRPAPPAGSAAVDGGVE